MDKDKKSFVLYTDQLGIFDKLTDEQAGVLIKHIFKYCNNEAPIADFITELSFESIKQQLKRDLSKWEVTKNGRSKAGLASVEARKLKKEQTLTNLTNVKSVKQNLTNLTVNVNDNVNVNVNDNVNVSDNVSVNDNDIIYPFNSENFIKFWGLWKKYKKDEHRFRYKTPLTEQAALKEIAELSNGDEFTAIKIIEESIANGYKGLFAISKQQNNGNNQSTGRTIADRINDIYFK